VFEEEKIPIAPIEIDSIQLALQIPTPPKTTTSPPRIVTDSPPKAPAPPKISLSQPSFLKKRAGIKSKMSLPSLIVT